MAHSVEMRTPLVDANLHHQLGPYLNAFKGFSAKLLLAMVLHKALPPIILQRNKTGIMIPVQHWLAEVQGDGTGNHRLTGWMQTVVNPISELAP